MKNRKYNEMQYYLKAYLRLFEYVFTRSLGRKSKSLINTAVRSELVCKEGKVKAITPFFWENHIDRIQGSRTYDAKKVVDNDLRRDYFNFQPVIVHWLKDAVLLDGSLYAGRHRQELRAIKNRKHIGFAAGNTVKHKSRASLASTCAGSTWWGHWILDEVPMQVLAEKYAPLIAFDREEHYDEHAYYNALGMSIPERMSVGLFDELVVVQEYAQNPLKTKRYHNIRKKLTCETSKLKKIFLIRGGTGTERNLVNENEISQRLEDEGFTTVDISKYRGAQFIEQVRGAEFIVSVEGSHLAPLLYLIKKYASIVILNPPCRVLTTIADVGVFCGISSSMFICEPAGDSKLDFYANPDELINFIEDAYNFGENNAARLEAFIEEVVSMESV